MCIELVRGNLYLVLAKGSRTHVLSMQGLQSFYRDSLFPIITLMSWVALIRYKSSYSHI